MGLTKVADSVYAYPMRGFIGGAVAMLLLGALLVAPAYVRGVAPNAEQYLQIFVPVVAALGLGTVAAAWISRSVAIGNHRQAWINALRDDLATFLRDLDSTYQAAEGMSREGATTDDLEQLRQARKEVLFARWRIVLRLNYQEQAHILLEKKLHKMLLVKTRLPEEEELRELTDLARRILKREWEVTKHPFLSKFRGQSE